MNPEAIISSYKSASEFLQSEFKSGRKISAARLKTLKEACKTINDVAKSIKDVVDECESKGKKLKSRSIEQKKISTAENTQTVEIFLYN